MQLYASTDIIYMYFSGYVQTYTYKHTTCLLGAIGYFYANVSNFLTNSRISLMVSRLTLRGSQCFFPMLFQQFLVKLLGFHSYIAGTVIKNSIFLLEWLHKFSGNSCDFCHNFCYSFVIVVKELQVIPISVAILFSIW